jgi:hypothetical protein
MSHAPVLGTARAMERETIFEYNFLIICRYMSCVKKSEDNSIANNCYNIKILNRLWEKLYLLFIE